MLCNKSKAQRHEERCAELRLRMAVPKISPARQAREDANRDETRRKLQHQRDHEEWREVLVKRKLDHYARELAEERYVTAMWGIRTSWRAIERAGIYFVWRKKVGLVTRRFTSIRPAWRHTHTVDKHHMGGNIAPIRPPLRPVIAPLRRAA